VIGDIRISDVDILPTDKSGGFWVQAGTACKAGLTSPNPREDAPSLYFTYNIQITSCQLIFLAEGHGLISPCLKAGALQPSLVTNFETTSSKTAGL
jgi:hypothetical protein